MIFLDKSGKRWRRIKLSTVGLTLLVSVPVATLIIGSFAYNPNWGLIPLVQHTTGAILSDALKAQFTNAPAPQPAPPAPKPAAKKSVVQKSSLPSAIAPVAASPSTASPTTTPPSQPVSSTTAPVTATPATSPKTVSPSTDAPGQTHKPVK